jgi:hypothetical protein
MTDFNIRSDSVDVEQIMRQIRARIREKRGVDYTEEEIRELANVKLEKFLDPRGVRSDLLEQFRRRRTPQPPPPNFAFEEDTLFETHRGIVKWIRALLKPILKLFFNPNPLIQALHIQSQLNARNAQVAAERDNLEALQYEVIHNLVIELTRVGIEVKNLKMRVESMSSRLDFDERRARALEGVVQYRPGAAAPQQPPTGGADRAERTDGGAATAESAERRNRRRRRRGRKRPGQGQPGSGTFAGHTEANDAAPNRERNGSSGDASTASGSSQSESRDETRAERSEPTGVPGAPPIQDRERSGASGDARAERSEPGGVQGPPPIQE